MICLCGQVSYRCNQRIHIAQIEKDNKCQYDGYSGTPRGGGDEKQNDEHSPPRMNVEVNQRTGIFRLKYGTGMNQ